MSTTIDILPNGEVYRSYCLWEPFSGKVSRQRIKSFLLGHSFVLYNKVKGTCLALFSIFTREYPVLDLLFYIVTCVEGAVPALRRFLFATVYSLVVRPIFHLDPGCMNNGNGLDNVANLLYPRNSMVVTLACGQMQEDSLHRRVGRCAE